MINDKQNMNILKLRLYDKIINFFTERSIKGILKFQASLSIHFTLDRNGAPLA